MKELPVEPWVLDRMEKQLKSRFPEVGKVKIGYEMKYLHPDDLQEHISKYKTFTTEHGRLVDINHFQILFLHKYGGSSATWTFIIEKSKKPNFPDKLICENVSGVSFIFPINK